MTVLETVYGNTPVPLADLNAARQLERTCRADVTTLMPGDRIAMLNFETMAYEAHTVVDAYRMPRLGDNDYGDHEWMVELEDSKRTFRCSPKFTGCHRVVDAMSAPRLPEVVDRHPCSPKGTGSSIDTGGHCVDRDTLCFLFASHDDHKATCCFCRHPLPSDDDRPVAP